MRKRTRTNEGGGGTRREKKTETGRETWTREKEKL